MYQTKEIKTQQRPSTNLFPIFWEKAVPAVNISTLSSEHGTLFSELHTQYLVNKLINYLLVNCKYLSFISL